MAELTVNHLRQNHEAARKVMALFESLLGQLDQDPRWTPKRHASFEPIRDFLAGPLVLLIRKKNEVLFPALEGLFSLHNGPLVVLRCEYEALLSHFREVCRAGEALSREEDPGRNIGAITASGRKGMELLRDHLYKEEKVLFPMVAHYLTTERDEELLKQMESLGSLLAPHGDSDP